MFSLAINVDGKYVKGKIKKSEEGVYVFVSHRLANILERPGHLTWTGAEIKALTEELNAVYCEVAKLNELYNKPTEPDSTPEEPLDPGDLDDVYPDCIEDIIL